MPAVNTSKHRRLLHRAAAHVLAMAVGMAGMTWHADGADGCYAHNLQHLTETQHRYKDKNVFLVGITNETNAQVGGADGQPRQPGTSRKKGHAVSEQPSTCLLHHCSGGVHPGALTRTRVCGTWFMRELLSLRDGCIYVLDAPAKIRCCCVAATRMRAHNFHSHAVQLRYCHSPTRWRRLWSGSSRAWAARWTTQWPLTKAATLRVCIGSRRGGMGGAPLARQHR